jgi:hypothetical protein
MGPMPGKKAMVDLAPDADGLPVLVAKSPPRAVAFVLIGIGILAVLGAGVVLFALPAHVGSLRYAVAGSIACAGAVFVLLGLSARASLRKWRFEEDGVHCLKAGLLGRREWDARWSEYLGVLARTERRSAGQATYVVYIVELKHASEKRRNVKAYESTARDGLRDKLKHYARLFGVPLLVETAEGFEERAPEDLDKTVRQRVTEGSLRTEFDPAAPPPDGGLVVGLEGDALVLRTQRSAAGVAVRIVPGIFLLAGIGVALAAALFSIPALFAMAGLQLALAAGAFVLLRGLKEELRISPETVSKSWLLPFGRFATRAVAAADIEDVVVAKPFGGGMGTSVQVVAGDTTLYCGRAQSAADKEWVRDCIIAVISR